MSANKNISVCVTISPRLLIKVDANRTSRKATGTGQPSGGNIIRPAPGPDQVPQRRQPARPRPLRRPGHGDETTIVL